DTADPLTVERIDARFPALAARISAAPGIGIVLVRSAAGPLCFWRGERYGLEALGVGPCAKRPDLRRVVEGDRDLMAVPAGPDVVGLQEVIREGGVPDADQAAYLASRLEMTELVMGETRAHGSGTYGNVVLSRLPVLGSGRCDLSCRMREPRGCLRVDFDVDGQ